MTTLSLDTQIPTPLMAALDGAFVDIEFHQSRCEFDPRLTYISLTADAMAETGEIVRVGELTGWKLSCELEPGSSIDDREEICETLQAASLVAGELSAAALGNCERCADTLSDTDGAGITAILALQSLKIIPEFSDQSIDIALMRELDGFCASDSTLVLSALDLPEESRQELNLRAVDADAGLTFSRATWPKATPAAREIVYLSAPRPAPAHTDRGMTMLRLVASADAPRRKSARQAQLQLVN